MCTSCAQAWTRRNTWRYSPCSVTLLASCSPIPPEVDLIPEDDHYRVQTRGDLAIYAHSKNRRGSSCYQWRVKPNVGKILAQGCKTLCDIQGANKPRPCRAATCHCMGGDWWNEESGR